VGEGSPYAIRYICHREAFCVRQTDSDILGSKFHPVEARKMVAGGEVEGRTGGWLRRE